jgi:peptidoglycan hydrolase-like protein with peptidoglycan-binding domain
MRTRALLLCLLVPLALAGPAHAQLPPVDPTTPPPAAPAGAKLSVGVASIGDRGKRWVLAGQSLVASGRLDPFVAGEKVTVSLYKGKKRIGSRTVKVKDDHGHGKFTTSFGGAKTPGSYFVVAKHEGTTAQKSASSQRARFGAVGTGGSSGEQVRLLQILLRRLAYVAPLSGHLDAATGRAVLAFRKVNGMSRISGTNYAIYSALFQGRGGFKLRFPKAGRHAEADLSRGVLVLADKGAPVRIYVTSPGKPSTPTVRGTFHVYRRSPGTNSHGMVNSAYFIRGYAVHGYADVPTYNASHGCLRVPVPNSRSIYDWLTMGTRVDVYA